MPPERVLAMQEPLAQVYQAAFRLPPYEKEPAEMAAFTDSLRQHVLEPGFRFMAGRSLSTDKFVGFCYGRHGAPGQLWYDLTAERLRLAGLGRWLTGVFQVCELAVHPAHQGSGLGGLLLDQLLQLTDCPRAVLATMAQETAASHLYERHNWRMLLNNIIVPGVRRRYKLMGLDQVHMSQLSW